MHVFAYSRRKGTVAAAMAGQIPEPVKRERSAALIALADRLSRENLKNIVAEREFISVLFETEENGYQNGHSDEFAPVFVSCPKPLHGELHRVKPIDVRDGRIYGVLLDE